MWFHDDDTLIEEETTKGKRDVRLIRRLLYYFRPYSQKIILAAGLLLLSTLLTISGPIIIKQVIDSILPRRDLAGLLFLSGLYCCLQIIVIVIRYFQQVSIAIVGEKAIADLKRDIFRHMITLPVSYFDQQPVGRLITRVEGDNENLKSLFSQTAVVLIQNLVLLLGMSVVMITVNARLYLIIFILLPVYLLAFNWFGRKVRPVYVAVRKQVAEINGFVMETIRGLPVVQVFCRQHWFQERLARLGREKFRLEMKAQSFWYRIWLLVDSGEMIGIMLVLAVGGAWALKGWVTIGALFLFITYIGRLFGPLRRLSDQINQIERAFAAAERVFGILDLSPEPGAKECPPSVVLAKGLTFENVHFSYDSETWVLSDINLQIRRGEKVALVGETGGGKTSTVALLLKFYEPQRGTIRIDGVKLHNIERQALRRLIGYVPQDVILFPGTILDNLRLFNPAVSEERVIEAARRARIHDRIAAMPAGYATNIIEQGINLSFGERQLLSFARVLIADPQLVILDEATSSVDPESERLIQEGIQELLRNRTAIIIAHRLTTTRLADRVVVLHKGRIVETGRHQELIKRRGVYYTLYQLQYLPPES